MITTTPTWALVGFEPWTVVVGGDGANHYTNLGSRKNNIDMRIINLSAHVVIALCKLKYSHIPPTFNLSTCVSLGYNIL